MTDKDDDELDISTKAFVSTSARKIEIFLSGAIGHPQDYIECFRAIRNASEQDVIYIYINSSGGYISTALQFVRVIKETDATVVCSVEGECMSAATMIFLQGNILEVTDHSLFMFHNYSGMSLGKGGEMYDNIIYEREWSEKLLKDIYKGFLTEAEINSMLDNKDIWMHSAEVLRRIKVIAEKQA